MHYILKDATENTALNILGPTCIFDGPCSCCCENKFTVSIICQLYIFRYFHSCLELMEQQRLEQFIRNMLVTLKKLSQVLISLPTKVSTCILSQHSNFHFYFTSNIFIIESFSFSPNGSRCQNESDRSGSFIRHCKLFN